MAVSSQSTGPTRSSRTGLLFGTGAYLLWGIFPLYFPLLSPSSPIEILAHRVIWSAVTMMIILVVVRPGQTLRKIVENPRTRWFLVLASVMVTINWGTYIYGVTTDRVVETSLGYFINPLVTVLMGAFILGERLRTGQWVAMAIASAAVLGLSIDYGQPPWIALTLAFSFATYGLAKKKADAGAISSLTFETMTITPLAVAYLFWIDPKADQHFFHLGAGHTMLLLSTGIVTAVPLLLFGAAATRISLTSLGLLQYLGPIIQFIIGVWVFEEHMSTMRWVGFCLVWLALIIFTTEAIRHRRQQLLLTAQTSAI